jgi:hypothetical protein
MNTEQQMHYQRMVELDAAIKALSNQVAHLSATVGPFGDLRPPTATLLGSINVPESGTKLQTVNCRSLRALVWSEDPTAALVVASNVDTPAKIRSTPNYELAGSYFSVAQPTQVTANRSIQLTYCIDGFDPSGTNLNNAVFSWGAAAFNAFPGLLVYQGVDNRPNVFYSNGTAEVSTNPLGPTPIPPSRWWRVTILLAPANGFARVIIERSDDATTNPAVVQWTTQGTFVDTASRAPVVMPPNTPMTFGTVSYLPGVNNLRGRLVRALLAVDGTTIVDIDPAASTASTKATTGQAITLQGGTNVTTLERTLRRGTVVVPQGVWTDVPLEAQDLMLSSTSGNVVATIVALSSPA